MQQTMAAPLSTSYGVAPTMTMGTMGVPIRADAEHYSDCSAFGFSVRCSEYLNACSGAVPGTRHPVSDTKYRLPGAWYQVPGTRHLVPNQASGIWNQYQLPGTRYLVPEHLFGKSEHLSGVLRGVFVFGEHCSGSAPGANDHHGSSHHHLSPGCLSILRPLHSLHLSIVNVSNTESFTVF
jgi:hypothetical protein